MRHLYTNCIRKARGCMQQQQNRYVRYLGRASKKCADNVLSAVANHMRKKDPKHPTDFETSVALQEALSETRLGLKETVSETRAALK